MTTAYDYWIHQQLEPDDKIVRGNYKRIHELKRNIVIKSPSPDFRTQAQIEVDEDEYLQRHGVPVKPRNNLNHSI